MISSDKLDTGIAIVISIVLIMVCGTLFTQRLRIQMRNPVGIMHPRTFGLGVSTPANS